MNKIVRLTLALAIIAFVGTSCKSKQKVAEISGANVVAGSTTPATAATTVTTNTIAQAPSTEKEVTRNESFSLSSGDASAFKSKYHVVVGSFKSIDNAKGLQSTLVKEGNKALVVVNEQGMYRVLMSSFNDYGMAHNFINNIKDRFPDAWVLVQK